MKSSFRLVVTAIFAALICLATLAVQIPIPATGGYVNLGDALILISAFLLSPLQAVLAAGLGSCLADILTGYIAFAPATLVIKAGAALIAALLFRRLGSSRSIRASLPFMILSGVLAELFMVFGYFAYEALILGLGLGAASGIPGNLMQGAAAVIISCAVTPALLRCAPIVRFTEKLR